MIIVVVDNKLRDLPTLISLANLLNEKYHIDVVLANIFEIDDLILLYKNEIDLILFSYMRDANKYKIAFARLHNIKIIIYDQEGANGLDGLGVLNDIKNYPNLLKCVNGYFFWGKKQLQGASKIIKNKHEIALKDIGYIRFDVNTNLLPKNKIFKKKFILVNSNFALIDPRYSTAKKEIEGVRKSNLYGKNLKEFILAMKNHRKRFLSDIKTLVIKNPKINFVLRPHPYEKIHTYEKICKDFSNCFMSSKYSSLNWVLHSTLVLHIDCMTSIEALSLNKKSLSLSYIVKNKNLCYKVPYLSSIHSKNFKDANNKINQIYFKGRKIKVKNIKTFKNYFGEKKNKPLTKLADELVEVLLSRDTRSNIDYKEFKKNFLATLILSKFPFRTRVKIFLRKYLSSVFFIFIYRLVVGKKIAKKYDEKCFDSKDISNYLKNTNKFKRLYSNSFIFSK